ncbi:MAG: hypothetical protein K8M05_28115 [Deltaproteobacteria bacterium]|nr:hypothetical protein [Kofleriaceae bacterium]
MAKATSDQGKKPADLAERLADPAFRAQIEEGLKNMPPEKAAELVAMLEDSLRRRKIELIGYLGAALVLLVGMVIALYVYGSSDRESFVTWIFLVPMGLAGLVMWLVGRWSNAARKKAKAARQGV